MQPYIRWSGKWTGKCTDKTFTADNSISSVLEPGQCCNRSGKCDVGPGSGGFV